MTYSVKVVLLAAACSCHRRGQLRYLRCACGAMLHENRHAAWHPIFYSQHHPPARVQGGGVASGGMRELIPTVARTAVAAGVDGIFMEVRSFPLCQHTCAGTSHAAVCSGVLTAPCQSAPVCRVIPGHPSVEHYLNTYATGFMRLGKLSSFRHVRCMDIRVLSSPHKSELDVHEQVHDNPVASPVDAPTQWPLRNLRRLLEELVAIARASCGLNDFRIDLLPVGEDFDPSASA